MNVWEHIEFTETIKKVKVGKRNQINASEIKENGKFPVIDQGQGYIAGFSDNKTKVINEDLPLIIFGDHTRCFKYIDFPFILGADGTKVLKPKDTFIPLYYYFALLNLNIPNRGYNRHFKSLKEQKIPNPPLPE